MQITPEKSDAKIRKFRFKMLSTKMLPLYVLLSFFVLAKANYQPAYQVMLFVQGEHHCNGVIVQRRLILTTAGCVYHNKNKTIYDPTAIMVVAGSEHTYQPGFTVQASAIHISEGFNATSLENDMAIVTLKKPLPLGLRDDIKWIILDDNGIWDNEMGLAYFKYKNKYQNLFNTVAIKILNKNACNSSVRETDVCALYKLPKNMDCKDFDDFVNNFGDRGTGLVGKSNLIGLLSRVLPPDVPRSKNCSSVFTKAIYTYIGSHLNWIYEIVANEEYIDSLQGNNRVSVPFQISSFKQALIPAPVDAEKPKDSDEDDKDSFIPPMQQNHSSSLHNSYMRIIYLIASTIILYFSY